MHSLDVDYHKLLPSLFQINAGYFLIQLSSEKDREEIYKTIGQHIRKDAGGVKQVLAHDLYGGNRTHANTLKSGCFYWSHQHSQSKS